MAGCVLRLATTTCGKADEVERVSKDVVGGVVRASVLAVTCRYNQSISQISYTVYFGKGLLLIWMLAASCFH